MIGPVRLIEKKTGYVGRGEPETAGSRFLEPSVSLLRWAQRLAWLDVDHFL